MGATLSISAKPKLVGSLAALASAMGATKASAFVSVAPDLTAMIAAVSLGKWPGAMAIMAIIVVGAGVAVASGVVSGISFKRRLLLQQS